MASKKQTKETAPAKVDAPRQAPKPRGQDAWDPSAIVKIAKGATTSYLRRQAGQRYTIHTWILANADGQTVAAVLKAIKPMKGGLGDLRIAAGAGAVVVAGKDKEVYASRKGTAQLPVPAAAPAA